MANYTQIYNFKNESSPASQGVRARVVIAVATAALAVLNESAGTANHANRVIWAKSALKDAETMGTMMGWAVLADPTFQAAPASATDALLQTIVNSVVDAFAG